VRRNALADICFRKDGQIVVRADCGIRLVYEPDVKRSALDVERNGVWEQRETDMLLERLAGRAVFFDIGANIGWFTLLAASKLPQLTVHAFEPVPKTFELLTRNVELNGLSNVVANNLGLWDADKQLRFTSYRGPKNFVTDDPHEKRVVEVPCVRLDSYVRQKGIDRIDFIKCDVEGTELHFLRGAQDTLRTFRPELLIETTEPCANKYGYSSRDVLEFLTALGYRYRVVTHDEGLVAASGDLQRDLSRGYNFLCTME